MERTIAAISTPQGNGGIAVIRISGNDAVKVADKVFSEVKNLPIAIHIPFITVL